jgi:tRNA threonylcarbamoyladenosine biosynthesis protein TsaB
LLALDTSGATASVAVYAGRVLAETTWCSGRRHSEQLIPAIDDTLSRAGVAKQSLAAIAVAAGPGSYAGLRVGVSTAMAMALALDLPLAQVPTLDVIARAQARLYAEPNGTIRAAIDVGRGRYATARFRSVGGHLEQDTPIESVSLDEMLDMATVEWSLLAVDLDPDSRQSIEHQYGARVQLASPAASLRRAGFLAELAANMIRSGELVGDLTVEPIYLHS